MKNLPQSLTHIIEEQGYDVESVFAQRLSGCDDEKLWNIIKEESRIFITLDLDFSDIRRILNDVSNFTGIMILRPRSKGPDGIQEIFKKALRLISIEDLWGKLIIVDPTKIRIKKIK